MNVKNAELRQQPLGGGAAAATDERLHRNQLGQQQHSIAVVAGCQSAVGHVSRSRTAPVPSAAHEYGRNGQQAMTVQQCFETSNKVQVLVPTPPVDSCL